jgi:hypothetical protein
MAGSRWRVGFDGVDWWSRKAGYYQTGGLDNFQHSTLLIPESFTLISTVGSPDTYEAANLPDSMRLITPNLTSINQVGLILVLTERAATLTDGSKCRL